jgi:cytochrome c5
MQTQPQRARRAPLARIVKLGWVAFLLLFTAACHLEMYDQPKYKALDGSDFYPDGASARPLVEGVVAREGLRLDETSTGRVGGDPEGAYIGQIPIQITPELLARGEQRYGIYCATCHGGNGNGRAAVSGLFNPRPPSFYDERLVQMPDGQYYDTIVNGKGGMYPYGSKIQNIEDRWAIIAHIRELQKNPPPENP